MLALLEDDPPSAAAMGTLVTHAAWAHLKPGDWRSQIAAPERAARSVCALFVAWIGLSVAGGCFQKETEEPQFAAAASHHALLAAGRTLVLAGAGLGAAAIAIGGVPLLWQALREALSRADRRLWLGLVLPFAGASLFAAVVALLLAVAPANVEGTSAAVRLALMVPLWAASGAFALACASAPRLVLLRISPALRALRRASRAGVALSVAMALVTVGLAVYVFGLMRLDPSLSAQSGGPLWPATGLVLAAAVGLAMLCTALGSLSAARALAAARS
jgi:MFS family permease